MLTVIYTTDMSYQLYFSLFRLRKLVKKKWLRVGVKCKIHRLNDQIVSRCHCLHSSEVLREYKRNQWKIESDM